MRIVRLVLSASLAASALVGGQILSTDYWLWSVAPAHAYGLVVFVALDAALIIGAWRRKRFARLGALLTAAALLVAMGADVTGGHPAGTPAPAFTSYLVAATAYLRLLI